MNTNRKLRVDATRIIVPNALLQPLLLGLVLICTDLAATAQVHSTAGVALAAYAAAAVFGALCFIVVLAAGLDARRNG